MGISMGMKNAMCFFNPLVDLHMCNASGMENRAEDCNVMDNFNGARMAFFVQDGGFLQEFERSSKREVGVSMVSFLGLA